MSDDYPDLVPVVKAGAKMLDEVYPEWFGAIDVQNLGMVGYATCVLGQLYGDYHDAVHAMNDRFIHPDFEGVEGTALEFGFDLGRGRSPTMWEALQGLWVDEIESRRETYHRG